MFIAGLRPEDIPVSVRLAAFAAAVATQREVRIMEIMGLERNFHIEGIGCYVEKCRTAAIVQPVLYAPR